MSTNPVNIFDKLKYNKNEEVKMIALSKIKCDPLQPRKNFNEDKLKELALDIELNGLLQPILLRQDGMNFVIIAGERRFRAYELLGNKETIPAIVRKDYSPESVGYLQMSENLKRDDLKFYEVAEFISSRINNGEAKGDIAKKLGISPQRISDYLTFIDAPEWLKALKDKFRSPQLFSKFAKEASKHDSLKDYLMSLEDEFFSNATLNSFKASLDKPNKASGEASDEATESPAVNSQDDHDLETLIMASGETSDEATESPAVNSQDDHDLETLIMASGETSDEATESPVVNSQDDHDLETLFMASGETSDEATESPAVNSQDDHDLETLVMASGETSDEATESPAVNSQDDDFEQQDDSIRPHLLKKPLILGFVDSREAELLYKQKAKTDGFIVVKFENGDESEILAESFQINRIIEG